jgi:hypothetical protein
MEFLDRLAQRGWRARCARRHGERDGQRGQQRTRLAVSAVLSTTASTSDIREVKSNKRVQFGYGLNYLIDIEHAVIVDVEATPARTYDGVTGAKGHW